MNSYKILLVDDDPEIIQTLQNRLVEEGYDVIVAVDGAEAVNKAKEVSPDIILLDLLLPKLNGFEVLGQVRKHFTEKWIPVIIISAQTDLQTMKKSYNLDADHYLPKPCTIENVLNGIRVMISLIPIRVKS